MYDTTSEREAGVSCGNSLPASGSLWRQHDELTACENGMQKFEPGGLTASDVNAEWHTHDSKYGTASNVQYGRTDKLLYANYFMTCVCHMEQRSK